MPAMVRVWREPEASAWLPAASERGRLGAAIPARNKVTSTTAANSRAVDTSFVVMVLLSLSSWLAGANWVFCEPANIPAPFRNSPSQGLGSSKGPRSRRSECSETRSLQERQQLVENAQFLPSGSAGPARAAHPGSPMQLHILGLKFVLRTDGRLVSNGTVHSAFLPSTSNFAATSSKKGDWLSNCSAVTQLTNQL